MTVRTNSISAMLSQDPCLGVVDLQALGQGEGLVERGDAVGVEVVHDQHHGLGVGIVHGQEFFDLLGPVDFGALGQGVHTAPAAQGSVQTKIEQVPQRTYSLSSRASRPGRAATGSRT